MTGIRCHRRLAAALMALIALDLLAGCAGSYQGPIVASADGTDEAAKPSFIAVDDPWEGMNSNIYAFNALADRWVLLPVVYVYTEVVH